MGFYLPLKTPSSLCLRRRTVFAHLRVSLCPILGAEIEIWHFLSQMLSHYSFQASFSLHLTGG